MLAFFRSEDDLLLSVDRFTSQLDDITSWLNETENVLNDRISAADREQMWKLLDIVKVHHCLSSFFKISIFILGHIFRADINIRQICMCFSKFDKY